MCGEGCFAFAFFSIWCLQASGKLSLIPSLNTFLGHLNFAASMSLCLICLLSTARRSGKAWIATGSLKEQYKNQRKNMACFVFWMQDSLAWVNETLQRRVVLPTFLVGGRFPWKEKRKLKTFYFLFFVFVLRYAPQAHSVKNSWRYDCMTQLCRQSVILK